MLFAALFALTLGTQAQTNDEVYDFTQLDEKPSFPGGDWEMLKFIAMNRKIVSDEGRKLVHVFVIVEKDGTLSNTRIPKSSGNEDFDKEALRIVKAMPK